MYIGANLAIIDNDDFLTTINTLISQSLGASMLSQREESEVAVINIA